MNFRAWAEKWLSGEDRSESSARAAESAEAWAARRSAWEAESAAWADAAADVAWAAKSKPIDLIAIARKAVS